MPAPPRGWSETPGASTICPDWRDREAWTCGPRPTVEAVEPLWSGPDHATTWALHVERFTPSIPDGLPEVEGTLTFRSAGVSVPSDGTRTVLDAAEDAGLSPSPDAGWGGRRCVVPLHSGTVVDRRDGRTSELAPTVQICVTAVVGDVEIEI